MELPGSQRSRSMRRMTLTGLGMTIAVLVAGIGPTRAQDYPWCAQRSDGSRYCGYSSYEQCASLGARGSCERNFLYREPGGAPKPKRGAR
jgi:hypothetical protein